MPYSATLPTTTFCNLPPPRGDEFWVNLIGLPSSSNKGWEARACSLSVLTTLELDTIVRGAFSVKDSFVLPDGEAEYKVVYDERAKGAFERLYDILRPKGYVPRLTGSRDECVLLVRKAQSEKGSSRAPVVLGLLTLAAVVAYGWLQYIVYQQLLPERLPLLMGVAYVVVLILVIGIHVCVHRRSANVGRPQVSAR